MSRVTRDVNGAKINERGVEKLIRNLEFLWAA